MHACTVTWIQYIYTHPGIGSAGGVLSAIALFFAGKLVEKVRLVLQITQYIS